MYGYIVPQKSTLRASDFVLYRSFYCGMCCETGRLYGQFPRFTTNYDFAFLSALMHDYAQADVVIEEHGCVLNPKKKAILQSNPLLTRLAAVNIMLCYQKADDGVADGDGVKYRAVRRALKKPFAAAKKTCPEAWSAIEKYCAAQREIESKRVAGVDRAADAFASLMRDLPELILGAQTEFVYLADALDDITEDDKHKRYNPFLATFGEFENRKQFIDSHRADLEFCFGSICGRAERCFDGLKLTQSHSLLKNIVFDGMRGKAEELLKSTKKLKNPRI